MCDLDFGVLERELENTVHEVGIQYRREEVESAIVHSSHPDIVCTALPRHWRSGRSFRAAFKVFAFFPVTDGVRVTFSAGNAHNPFPDVRNNEARMFNQVARFQDLRLIGKSGRGKEFRITVTIHTVPQQVAILRRGIKVTADGIRKKRIPSATTATAGLSCQHRRSPQSDSDDDESPSPKRRHTSESSSESSTSESSSFEVLRPVAVRPSCAADPSVACSIQPRVTLSPTQIPFCLLPGVIESTSPNSFNAMDTYMQLQLQQITPYWLFSPAALAQQQLNCF